MKSKVVFVRACKCSCTCDSRLRAIPTSYCFTFVRWFWVAPAFCLSWANCAHKGYELVQVNWVYDNIRVVLYHIPNWYLVDIWSLQYSWYFVVCSRLFLGNPKKKGDLGGDLRVTCLAKDRQLLAVHLRIYGHGMSWISQGEIVTRSCCQRMEV